MNISLQKEIWKFYNHRRLYGGPGGTQPPVEKQVFKNLGEKLYRLALLVLTLFMFLVPILSHFKALNSQKSVASEGCTPNPPEILLYATVIHAVPVL